MASRYWLRRILAGLMVSVGGIGLAACGHTTSSTHASSSPRPPSSAPKRSSSGSSTARASGGSPSGPTALSACGTAALSASLGQPSGAAGTTYYFLLVKNVSTHACTVYGYPGVSLVESASGAQVGRSATRVTAQEQTVTLEPGASARAILGVAVAQNYPTSTCQPTKVGGLLVYPPNQSSALYVSAPNLYGCASRSVSLLTIEPFAPANSAGGASLGGASS